MGAHSKESLPAYLELIFYSGEMGDEFSRLIGLRYGSIVLRKLHSDMGREHM
jgi:hypothetical protein